jgi:hypothetical protein
MFQIATQLVTRLSLSRYSPYVRATNNIGQTDGQHRHILATADALHSLVFPHEQPSPVEENTVNQSFTPVRVGGYTLPNRLVMAPMTRSRAKFDGTPGELAAEYYSQRASVGLIVTEGTQPSDDGQGYLAAPGIYSPAHGGRA